MSENAWSVSPARLHQLGGDIRTSSGRFLNALEHLTETVEPLIAANLDENGEGQTGQAMDRAKKEWTDSATRLQTILDNIGIVTQELSDGYTSADKHTTSLIGQYGI
ncbi:MAG: WXG100 family type VII secretion target [Micrococcales bacterium]|nr:WXG100 family type VII secretion target [Micrococcales bacterium]